jgi:hypothetical protein
MGVLDELVIHGEVLLSIGDSTSFKRSTDGGYSQKIRLLNVSRLFQTTRAKSSRPSNG